MMIRGVVIEGPVWDARFYGEWLLAAARADILWKECLSDQDFENKVSRIGVRSNPDFGITAIVMLNWLGGRRPRFVINVDGDEGEDFVLMAGMGFFIPKYQTYQMAVPSGLAVETVRMALSDYAKTEDDEGLHFHEA